MKKGIFLSLLLVANQVFALQHSNHTPFAIAELLYWQVSEVSDDNWGQVLSPTGVYQQHQFLDAPFNWKPGLRVGAGLNRQDSPWQLLLYYTGYQGDGKKHVSTGTDEVHSAFLGNFFANNLSGAGVSGPYYKQAGMHWKVLFHTLDLELGRITNIGTLGNVRPFVGLKAAKIDQSIRTIWLQPYNDKTKQPITTFSSANEDITNDFKGIGPSFGLDTTWYLYQTQENTVNLIGHVAGAFLWGRWVLSDVYQNNTPVTITVNNDNLSSVSTTARGYVGLDWVRAFHSAEVVLRIGYEGQVWFNQLRYYSFDMGRTNDALFLHGGVLGVSLHA